MPYDPAKWVAIGMLATSPFVLTVGPGFAATNLAKVIAYAKAKPSALTVAMSEVGGLGCFATIEFEQLAHVKFLHVPYAGKEPEVTDLLGGHVKMTLVDLAPVLPFYRAGKLKVIAAGTTGRFSQLPDVLTFAESGVPDYRAVTFFGLVAPPGTPKALADKINRDVVNVMKQPTVFQKIETLSLAPRLAAARMRQSSLPTSARSGARSPGKPTSNLQTNTGLTGLRNFVASWRCRIVTANSVEREPSATIRGTATGWMSAFGQEASI